MAACTTSEELDAIQWDSLAEEMASARVEYQVVNVLRARLNEVYNAAKRG